jgi:hypothetical protein
VTQPANVVAGNRHKRFFECDDNGEAWWAIVALDLNHAKQILRNSGVKFRFPSLPLHRIASGVTWRELTIEEADRMRCDLSDMDPPLCDRVRIPYRIGLIPLADCEVGEFFFSEG